MATVFLARDERIGREVALKKLHPHLLSNPETVRRFTNEASAIAKISHENIIKIFDCDNTDRDRFIVMEHIQGQTLLEILNTTQTIPNLILLNWFRQLFEGLGAAHTQGIFHRDIKPSNIMIDQNGTLKIMDFGVAYLVHQEQLTATGSFVGTPDYISPEQALSLPLCGKSDVFSAGTLLYQCATGKSPFARDNLHATIMAIAHDQPVPPLQHNRALLDIVCTLIERCHVKDPALRGDAAACSALIDSATRELPNHSSKERSLRFLQDAPLYCKIEQAELFTLFQQKAQVAGEHRQNVVALKTFELAGRFGTPTDKDCAIIRRLEQQSTLKTIVTRTAIAGVVLLLIALTTYQISLRLPIRSKIATVVAGTDDQTPDTAAVPLPSPRQTVSHQIDPPIKKSNTDSLAPSKNPASVNQLPAVARDGWLTIKTSPPWTRILIDGALVGRYPEISTIRISAGLHTLTVQKDGCIDFSDSLTIIDLDTMHREIVLKPLSR